MVAVGPLQEPLAARRVDTEHLVRAAPARGVRGIVVDCADCGEQHFHEWSLLRASLQQLLEEGHMRPHEPAFDPDPAEYVSWEYCRGYADAVLSDG